MDHGYSQLSIVLGHGRERRRRGKGNELIGCTSMLNGFLPQCLMAACGF